MSPENTPRPDALREQGPRYRRLLSFRRALLIALGLEALFLIYTSVNWVDLPEGRFTAKLFSARSTLTFSPRMFVAGLVQYNSTSSTFSTNVRFRWEYQPGSDFFVVYTDGRDTLTQGVHGFLNRSAAVKLTRLLRF